MRTVLAVVLVPVLSLVALVTVAGGAFTTQAEANRATACTYRVPDPNRIAVAMEQLTVDPVDEDHWNTNAATAGYPAVAWAAATIDERHQFLVNVITTVLATVAPHAVTTPVIIWWHGAMPASNDDHRWQTVPVPGWSGTLATYLSAFTTVYATNPTVTANPDPTPTSCTPPSDTCRQPVERTAILATIRRQESGGTYLEQHRSRATGYSTGSGNPSGAYQFLHDTWNGYGGYDEAFQAPASIQDQKAAADVDGFLARYGRVDWVPVAWYVGADGADNVRDGTWPLSYLPNPGFNTVTIGDYQHAWMSHYISIALPAAGISPAVCPTGAAAVIAWADSQIGAPYATINPYRFGTPPWPGGPLVGLTGRTYDFPAGTTVYDCSGFVVAAWRRAGVDYPGQYGIYVSDQWNTPRLPDAPRSALAPGDIAVYSTDAAGNGHVVLIHDIDPTTGTVHTIEASGSHGVTIGTLDWTRVIAIKRT